MSIHQVCNECGISANVVTCLNGIKDDNRLDNLEWVTPKENAIHAVKNGLKPITQKMRDNMVKMGKKYGAINGKVVSKPVYSLNKLKLEINDYASTIDASKYTNIGSKNINNSLRLRTLGGDYRSAGGLYWFYSKEKALEVAEKMLSVVK